MSGGILRHNSGDGNYRNRNLLSLLQMRKECVLTSESESEDFPA